VADRGNVTRRQGRPYTLVLHKTDALFAREQEARARDVGPAELVCAFGLGDQLVADGEADLDGRWGQGGQDQVADGGVDDVAGQVLADRLRGADAVVLADVAGYLGAVAGVVADGHPAPAPAADDQALQQRGAFARRAGGAAARGMP
jgi:hypothetical protein